MNPTGNTILITGGTSGIGRALAERLHQRGNTVIVAGRNRAALDEITAAHPGIHGVVLDIADPASIAEAAARIKAEHPNLNILVNNAGIMLPDAAADPLDEQILTAQISTNLLGTLRVTSAFIDHLKQQPAAAVVYNTSTLAFTPLAPFAVYSATKAALHSYVLSQRFALRDTSVQVKEIVPPWVATGLVGEAGDPRAMPVDQFADDALALLADGADEIVVKQAEIYRNNAGPAEHAYVEELNTYMAQLLSA